MADKGRWNRQYDQCLCLEKKITKKSERCQVWEFDLYDVNIETVDVLFWYGSFIYVYWLELLDDAV